MTSPLLFLTSNSYSVTKSWVKHLPKPPSELRLTFIPTAAEVESGDLQWLKDDRQTLVDIGFTVTDFTCTSKTPAETKAMLDQTDVVFVAGGNTFFLLQEMQKSGFTKLIKKYLDKGVAYVGSSAGSVVAGPDIAVIADLDDRKCAPELTDAHGLGLTDLSIFPHWGSAHFQKKYEKAMKTCYQKGFKIVLLNDDQYLFVHDGTYQIVAV